MQTIPPPFEYRIVEAEGKGTCSGIETARSLIPRDEPFAIVWSDLYPTTQIIPPSTNEILVGTSSTLNCRWKLENGTLSERTGDGCGVVGIFYIATPSALPEVPTNGEFVRFLKDSNLPVTSWEVQGVHEIGTIESYIEFGRTKHRTRYFNEINRVEDSIVKLPKDEAATKLQVDETAWYDYVARKGFRNIPAVRSTNPLRIEFIPGHHPYAIVNNTSQERRHLLKTIFDSLNSLHNIEKSRPDREVERAAYLDKTLDRISLVSGVFPWRNDEQITINGKSVRNFSHETHKAELESAFADISPAKEFVVIHGDPTFSNIIVDSRDGIVKFIDPRGYFGNIKLYGDPRYDYAKLFYSVNGNYDSFNNGDFQLKVNKSNYEYRIGSTGWEDCTEEFRNIPEIDIHELKLIHAFIWLSLTGYVKEDYDGIIVSFLRGCELLEEALGGT